MCGQSNYCERIGQIWKHARLANLERDSPPCEETAADKDLGILNHHPGR